MNIPQEGRATMCAYRAGRTEAKFLDEMWERCYPEEVAMRATGKWPMLQGAQLAEPAISDPANTKPVKVTKIRGAA